MNALRNIALALCLLVVPYAHLAAATSEVNVYSYRQPFLIKPLFDVFTRESGIDVNVVFANKGLVERLKREGRNSPADLIFTVDIGRLHDAASAGVTQSMETPTLQENIPSQFRDPDGHWYGLTTRARIIVVSKDRVEQGEIATYQDLADPAWRGRVCMRSGKHVYNVALVASMIAHDGRESAEAWLKGVKSNLSRKPQGNDRAQVKAIQEGVCDLALINHYYMGAMLQDEGESEWANAVRIVFPDQGGRGTHVNISGMALTQSAPNRDNAVKLMEFLSGDLAQRMYAEQNFEYPVRPGTQISGLLESFGEFRGDDLSLVQVARLRADAIRLLDEVNFDE